ncbi:MAG TPA: multidrug efflux SMR transporter [Chlamydiales bacterium]|nr:multidrug efflux SMR transporter [Chlamydiales bacterium]
MNWVYLFIAGIFEIIWAVSLKYTEGYTKLVPSIYNGISMVVSVWLLSYALRTIPLSTGYAIWTGIGACGTIVFGMVYLNESRDPIRIACILLIIASIIALKIVHKEA